MSELAVNARILAYPISGLQRYLMSMLKGFDELGFSYRLIAPQKKLDIVRAHLWEQIILPCRVKPNTLLWSPANSGPVSFRDQVVTVHDILHLDRPDLHVNGTSAGALYRWMLPRLLARAQHIVTISNYTKSRLMERLEVPEEKITVIYRTVDPQFCPTDAEVIRRVRRRYHIDYERYVLSLGSLDLKKNLVGVVRAWTKLAPRFAGDTGLVLAGKLNDRLALHDLGLDGLPQDAMFTGYVNDADLPALYSGASCFVFPSLYEGFGLPPLEAMACGTPTVVSNITSLPEVCGDAALYVDPLNADDIAEGLRFVLEDVSLAGTLCKKGLARAAQFSWKKCVEEHRQLFQFLMKD